MKVEWQVYVFLLVKYAIVVKENFLFRTRTVLICVFVMVVFDV